MPETRRRILALAAGQLHGGAAIRRHFPEIREVLGPIAVQPLHAHRKPLAIRRRRDAGDTAQLDVVFDCVRNGGHALPLWVTSPRLCRNAALHADAGAVLLSGAESV